MDNSKENIFQTARRKKHNYMIPSNKRSYSGIQCQLGEIGIFIHLHYKEDLEYYLAYLKNIPTGIHIYISVSDSEMQEEIENYICCENIQKCQVIRKENRGRDISALLVAFREIILNYKYVCFIHDKKAKGHNEEVRRETQAWIEGMWNNLLVSEDYIYNIIGILEEHQELGLLVPPELPGIWCAHAYADLWKTDFDNTLKLAEDLELDCNIDAAYPFITVGTVFWGRVSAVKKLLVKEWKYEDFQEEPLPLFGTIGHAVERVLGYVAQDAGYETGYAMSLEYAQEYIFLLKDTLREAYNNLVDVGVYSLARRELYHVQRDKIVEFIRKYPKIYFYGPGYFGRECCQIAAQTGKKPEGFLISRRKEGQTEYLGIPVYPIDEFQMDEETGILITVGAIRQEEIVMILEERGIKNFLTVF